MKGLESFYKCEKCEDMGFYIDLVGGEEIAKECECRKKMITETRLRFANIPETFKDMTIENFDYSVYKQENKEILSVMRKSIEYYIENFEALKEKGIGLYIRSSTRGSGKTRMAASIANKLLENYQVKFAVSSDILKEIKATYNKDSEYTESQLVDALKTCEVLIIDDFGVEKMSDWVNEQFYTIINYRYVNKKVTIFTSNESLEELEYNSRITNRILERTFQIQFPNESVREKISKQNNINLIKLIKEK